MNLQALAGTSDEHVETPLATFLVEGTKVHRHVATVDLAVADADQNHVSLVALHVLQVLDEERLLRVIRKERLGGQVLATS